MYSKAYEPFINPADQYKRQLNPLIDYRNQTSFYLHRVTKRPLDECIDYVRAQLKDKLANPTLPLNELVIKDSVGDRVEHHETMQETLRRINDGELLLTPSLVGYCQPSERKSVLGDFIDTGLANRKRFKHAMFEAKRDKKQDEVDYNNKMQNGAKIDNNSLSGVQSVGGTAIFNPSAHPSLTSICRLITSHGNLNNERMVAGNRYYRTAEITLADLTTLAHYAYTHHDEISKVLTEWGMHLPTTDEVMATVRYSSDLYWNNAKDLASIHTFVDSCTDVEKAYIVYCGDLYHLAKYNDSLIRGLFDYFGREPGMRFEDPVAYANSCNADVHALASLLQAKLVGQSGLGKLKDRSMEDYTTVVGQMGVIQAALSYYGSLIETFLKPPYLPPNLSEIEFMVRRAVVLSDTDSSVVTMQEWSKWYYATNSFAYTESNAWYIMTFILTQTLKHVLFQISANIGIRPDRLHVFEMKNEFGFTALMLSTISKHYFAGKKIAEGVIMDELEMEIKGVNLRGSYLPKLILNKLDDFIERIMTTVSQGGKVNANQLLMEVADIEQMVKTESMKGSDTFLRSSYTKSSDSYSKQGEEPKLKQHALWNEVFAPKYGNAPELPYRALTLPLKLNTAARYTKWIDDLEDKALADRLRVHNLETDRTDLPRFRLPMDIANAKGIPKELLEVLDLTDTIRQAVTPFYLVLQTLGVYVMDDDGKVMLSDTLAQ